VISNFVIPTELDIKVVMLFTGFFYPSPGDTLGSFAGVSLKTFTITQTIR
jgi:hypothetical protein